MSEPFYIDECYEPPETAIIGVGHTSAKSSSYDGMTDEEADALQAELKEMEARRIPAGFRKTAPVRRVRGVRPAGSWPKVPRFDVL